MEYIILNIFLFIGVLIEILKQNGSKIKRITKLIILLEIIVLCVFIGFRVDVGYDYDNYRKIFNMVKELSFYELLNFKYAEIGYTYVNVLISNFYVVIFVIAVFNIVVKYNILKKMSAYPFFSLCIYLSYSLLDLEFGKIRSAIVTTFVLLSIFYLKEKKFFKFIMSIIIGFFFHKSILLTIIFPFIKEKNYKFKYYVYIFLASYFFRGIITKIILEISNISKYIYDKISYYEYLNQGNSFLYMGINLSLLIRITIFIFLYKNRKKFNNFDMKLMNIYYFGIIMYVLFSSIPELTRISNYFRIVEIILIPNILKDKKNITFKLFFLILFFLYSILTTFKIVYSTPQWFLPYKNLLFMLLE